MRQQGTARVDKWIETNTAWFGAAILTCRVETTPNVTTQEGVPPWGGHPPMCFKPTEFNNIAADFAKQMTRQSA
jgi:hypothetical protein